jgi:hypothetical protein
MKTAMLLALTLLFLQSPSWAQSSGGSGRSSTFTDFTKRAANREKGRWSLSEWLEMKERNKMMDMWLSMNSPSPFEFAIGGSYNAIKNASTTDDDKKEYNDISGEFSAYAQLVGLTAEYENNTKEEFSDLSGIFNLRVIGNSIQNTGFTLSYGLRTRDITDPANKTRLGQQFGQAALQLYLTKYFGLDGKYRYFMPTNNEELGDVKEDLAEGGVFIDFNAFRVFGSYYRSIQKATDTTTQEETLTERTGVRTGIKIFF